MTDTIDLDSLLTGMEAPRWTTAPVPLRRTRKERTTMAAPRREDSPIEARARELLVSGQGRSAVAATLAQEFPDQKDIWTAFKVGHFRQKLERHGILAKREELARKPKGETPAQPAATVEDAPEPKPAKAPKPVKPKVFKQVKRMGGKTADDQFRWFCSACQKSFILTTIDVPEACPEGHAREVADDLAHDQQEVA